MKKTLLAALLSSLFVTSYAADLTKNEDKIVYTIGSQIGETLQNIKATIPLNEDILFEAITDSLNDKPSQLSDEDMNAAMQSLQQKMNQYMTEKAKAASEANRAEGDKFLANNKTKAGVKVTDSGLQYRVIKNADGAKPSATDRVKVNYKGSLPDGTEFDNSAQSGAPVEFPLNAVIPGWTEGLQLMSVGSTYEFVIPPKLGYGEMAPPMIGPNRVLIFEVELVEIIKADDKQPTEKTASKAAENTAPASDKATEKQSNIEKTVEKAVDQAKDNVKAGAKAADKAIKEGAEAVKDSAKKAVEAVAQ